MPAATWNAGRPWVTLNCNGMHGTYTPQLLIDLVGLDNSSYCYNYIGAELSGVAGPASLSQVGGMYFSPVGGFSDGSNTQRPWVNTEVGIGHRSVVEGGGGTIVYPMSTSITGSTPWTGRMHFMRSTDGTCNRVLMYYNQNLMWYFHLDVPGNPFTVAGTSPASLWNAAGVPWFGAWYCSAATNTRAWRWTNFASVAQYTTTISSGSNPTTNYKTKLGLTAMYNQASARYAHNTTAACLGDGSWPRSAVALACNIAGYTQDNAGYMIDARVVSDIMNDGDYDRDGTYGWICAGGGASSLGAILLPWNQSTLNIV